MTTNALYEHLQTRNPNGLPREDAIQVFLWLFCTTAGVPESLRHVRITKELLSDTFERLEQDGLIHPTLPLGIASEWSSLVERLLSNQVEVDFDFEEKLRGYL